MAELMIVTAVTCATNLNFGPIEVEGSRGEIYRVSYGLNRNPARSMAMYGPHCTCPGFTYRKTCKHIAALEMVRCAWNGACDPGVLGGRDGTCPECRGPVEPVSVGV